MQSRLFQSLDLRERQRLHELTPVYDQLVGGTCLFYKARSDNKTIHFLAKGARKKGSPSSSSRLGGSVTSVLSLWSS
jgi:hypothetical protein